MTKCCVCRQTFTVAEIMNFQGVAQGHLEPLALAPLCLDCQRKKLYGLPLEITDPAVLAVLQKWFAEHDDPCEMVVRDTNGRILTVFPPGPMRES